MTVHDRLKLLRGSGSYKEFAERFGASINTVRRYEQGAVRIPLDFVEQVCREFGVSADWLVFGVEADPGWLACTVGSVDRKDGRSDNGGGERDASRNGKRYVHIEGEKVRIVCVPVLTRVPAGEPEEMQDAMPVGWGLEGEVWIPDPHDVNAYGLIAHGDSMDPLIRDGETFIVSPRRAYDLSSGVAVVRIPGGQVCVKYVRRHARSLDLMSANPRYPRMTFDLDEAHVIGEVVQVIGRE